MVLSSVPLLLALSALTPGRHPGADRAERSPAAAEQGEKGSARFSPWTRGLARLRSAETRLLERFEPPNDTDLSGKKPTLLHGLLNLGEVAAARLGLMRPAKVYSAWVEAGHLMRGSEQDGAGFAALRGQGIDTVINLKREDHSEKPIVEALGMRSVHLPIYDQSLPSPREIQAFLAVAEDPASGKVYVHCEQGVGRTGVMVAVYRIHHDGLSADAAIAEAKGFGMTSAPQVDFLRRYAAALARGAAWTR